MEDRKLTEKESLELISQMIRNTQAKLEEKSGTMFLIWGYVTIAVTLFVWLTLRLTQNADWHGAWFLLPLVAGTISWFHIKREVKKPRAYTFIDRIINYIWVVMGASGFILSLISMFFHKFPILFVIALIMGMGTTLTGLTIRFRALVVSGVLGMLASVVFLFTDWQIQMLVFAFVFLVMMVIPGHILNSAARKQNK